MATTLQPQSELIPVRKRDSHAVAWGVILISFGVFCVTAALALVWGHYFLFQSTIPLSGQIQVSRGTASMLGADRIEQAVRSERNVELSGVVTTDAQSQASVNFADPYENGVLLATVTLKNGASMMARQFTRPRFNWSAATYQIVLEDMRGEFSISISSDLPRPVEVTISEPSGVHARLLAPGRYLINANEAQFGVVNMTGDAIVTALDARSYPIPIGQQGTAQIGDPSRFMYAPALVNLFGTSGFTADNVQDFNAALSETRSLVWRCNSVQNAPPEGGYQIALLEGQPALRLVRGDGAESHGETLCVQAFNASQGLDVSAFRHVSIRVRFKVVDHSLSACGVDGSECPLMLRMEYYPVGSREVATWIHGFFVRIVPGLDFPLQCDSCGELHEVINPDRWYTYESGNLLTKLTPDQRPASILNFRFYASGHQYDVWVREVELLVDQAIIPISGSGSP